MTAHGPEMGEALAKLLAKAIDGPTALFRAASVATLVVAEYLANLIDCQMASDIHDIKESLLRKVRAEGEKAVIEATDAANRVARRIKNDAIARAQQTQLEATAKTQNDAKAALMDAETRGRQVDIEGQARLIEAKAHFIEAVAKLQQEGGDIFFDREALQRTLDAGPPPESTQPEAEAG